MRGKPLNREVTTQEMLQMRQSGMTNQDIANALGISYSTVHKYIGVQSTRGGRIASKMPRENSRQDIKTLPILSRTTTFKGVSTQYVVDEDKKTVSIISADDESSWVTIRFDDFRAFCDEVQAVGGYLEKVKGERNDI